MDNDSMNDQNRNDGAAQAHGGEDDAVASKAGRVKAAVKSAVKKVTPRPFAGKAGPRLSPLQTPRVMVIANQKGGVGKTTTAINLATAMCAVGKTVLLIDLDPQGNASTGLGIRRADIHASTYDMLFAEAAVTDIAKPTKVPGLWVAPSSVHLSGAEIELVTAEEREYRLRNALKAQLPYEYVIIDCPPSLNLLTLNAMVAADAVVVPLQCEFYALEGLSQLVKTVERVQKHYNPGLDIQGIVLTMYDKRNNLATMVAEDVREHFGDKVYKAMIPRNVRVSEAPSFGLPAIVYDMKCTGSEAYIKLAGEVLKRERVLLAEKKEQSAAMSA
jgi:chromosome partitioning protein